MYSLIVAIKTHPRDAEKIVVVMVDNKTRPFLQLYFDLANGGWTDDFPVSDGIEHHQAHQHNGLRHIQTGMCHFLVASDPTASFPMEAAEYAANDIFELHEQSSARLPPSFSKYSTAPIAVEAMRDLEPADVSFMCTSHSELRDLHGDCELIGKFLAASGRSAVWPGNDRNNMKSLYNALTGCRRLIGVITEHLADAATWNGKIPDCTHPIMASHIYERTLLLIMLGKMHAIFPVGVGGILEIACRLLLDDHFPDFRDRPAIFYSPDYARAGSRGLLDTIVALFLGEAEYRSICQGVYSNASGRRCPYYLVRNLNDLRNLISNLSISRGSPYGM